jgi:hypothetical protein
LQHELRVAQRSAFLPHENVSQGVLRRDAKWGKFSRGWQSIEHSSLASQRRNQKHQSIAMLMRARRSKLTQE